MAGLLWRLFSYKYLLVCLAESLKVSVFKFCLWGVCCPDCKSLRLFCWQRRIGKVDWFGKMRTVAWRPTSTLSLHAENCGLLDWLLQSRLLNVNVETNVSSCLGWDMAGTLHCITKTLISYKEMLGGGMNSLGKVKLNLNILGLVTSWQ